MNRIHLMEALQVARGSRGDDGNKAQDRIIEGFDLLTKERDRLKELLVEAWSAIEYERGYEYLSDEKKRREKCEEAVDLELAALHIGEGVSEEAKQELAEVANDFQRMYAGIRKCLAEAGFEVLKKDVMKAAGDLTRQGEELTIESVIRKTLGPEKFKKFKEKKR